MAMIEVKNLSFTYPAAEKAALRDVSFSIARAEFCVLCGKSRLRQEYAAAALKKICPLWRNFRLRAISC